MARGTAARSEDLFTGLYLASGDDCNDLYDLTALSLMSMLSAQIRQ